ncbi:hypothetical protein TEHD86_0212 [Tetragenococcus halophilus subsp. halophilus]|nr:hypothetical protein TEHD86_0212 [Tetragenococcus halophilus subsp. halophilus]
MEKENRFSIGDISQYLNIILWSMIISIIALISFQRSNGVRLNSWTHFYRVL